MERPSLRIAGVCPRQAQPVPFITTIWQRHPTDAWLFLAAKKGSRWIERPIKNDADLTTNIRDFLREHPKKAWDLYFCPNAFASPRRKKTEALRTFYAWCDIDNADPERFMPPPGVLWMSSPGRFQGLWLINRKLQPPQAECISRYMAHEFGADRSGWEITKVLRVPGTYNHKRDGKPPKVKLLRCNLTPIDPKPLLRIVPKNRLAKNTPYGIKFDLERDPVAMFKKYRKRIKHDKARMMLRHKKLLVPDRSAQIFTMMKGLHEAEVPWNDIACLIWHSIYFRSKHGADINALEAEIQRGMTKLDTGVT